MTELELLIYKVKFSKIFLSDLATFFQDIFLSLVPFSYRYKNKMIEEKSYSFCSSFSLLMKCSN